MPLVLLSLTALAGQVSASRTHSSHGTEGQSPCAVHIRRSTHTWPVRMCQQCSASTMPLLIPHRPTSQPLLRHIPPGLCVLFHMMWDNAHGRLSFCASRASEPHCTRRSGLSVTDSQLSWHRRAVSVCSAYPAFDAHVAGSDVPTVLCVHDAAADLSPPRVSTAVEAHPARSLCAFADAVGQWHASR